ncbi:MAG: TMP repeat protein [Candidatus Collierbacteria bacterium GW2011_GWB1_44_6]|uniref:TMP repeat protein n=1 Tax=Candidatus Collierbacteria bacterium GW2011_GWB1_44_6 TaxID=1618384 RepID=A0A0G1LVC8_9BACT|nr:MAG: TMP repeat protein [Candidatus Collierbacteria bacterium GW2011_GWB1_44_6]
MAESRELSLILSLKDEASKSLKGFKKNVAEGLADVGKGLTVAGGAITAFMGLSVKASAEAEEQIAKFDAVLNTMGSTAVGLRSKILEVASASSKLGFDDEATALSVAKLYQRTGDLNQAISLNALAMDLSRAKSIDLADASNMVGLVLSGNSRVLKQYGIDIKDSLSPAEALKDLQGKLAGQSEAFAGTFSGQMAVFNENFTNLRETIGASLMPILNQFLQKVTGVITKIQEWGNAHPALFDKIIKVVAVVGGLMLVLGPLLVMLPGISIAIGVLGGLFTFLAGPVGLIILAIGALIAVGYLLITHWDQVKAYASSVWESVYSTISGVITRVRDFVVGVLTSIRDFFVSIWNGILNVINVVFGAIATAIKYWLAFSFGLIILFLDTFLPGWQEKLQAIYQTAVEVFTAIGNFFVATWEWIQMAWQSGVDFISNLWTTVWTAISNFIMPIVGAVQEKISAMWAFLKDLFTKASKPLTDAWNTLWDGIKGVASSAWEGIKDVVKSGINWIIDKLNWFIQKANEVASKGAGALGITVPNISQIPRLAKGGIVTSPTFAQIGEAGPEAVKVLCSAKGFVKTAELAEMVGDLIMDKMRLNGKLAL